ncbi:MAG: 50S ribosomal protein L21 [Firmicutes bacterium]|nr:50S ribosomal protein L21 [Bacillota bacterium]
MYAVFETGGKQYKVSEGDVIKVEKLSAEVGMAYDFDRVLLASAGGETRFGRPYVDGAVVTASVLGDGKEKKVIIYKFKSKKGFHKKRGHRQPFTRLKIEKITV